MALIIAATTTGVGGVLIMAGLIGLVTGVYTLVTRRGSWLALTGRKAGLGVVVGALVVVCVGSGVYGATGLPDPRATAIAGAGISLSGPSPTPGPHRSYAVDPTPTASSPAVAAPAPSAEPVGTTSYTALTLLATLPVKGRAPKTGYDRTGMFGPAWEDVDRNGCDTRNDILRRDLTHVTVAAGTHGCVVLSGVLTDPYTGREIAFQRGQGTSTAVQIDHVVALLDAWQSGAQQLSQTQRVALANDPLNLLAVDGSSNDQKSASNAASWLPPAKGFRCAYVARQVTVKAEYRLWVTRAERDAMASVLRACPQQPIASGGTITLMPDAVVTVPTPKEAAPAKPAAPKPAPAKPAPPKPAPPKPAPPKPAPPAAPVSVHPGAFCTPLGATGVTSTGRHMRCTSPDGKQARWRAG